MMHCGFMLVNSFYLCNSCYAQTPLSALNVLALNNACTRKLFKIAKRLIALVHSMSQRLCAKLHYNKTLTINYYLDYKYTYVGTILTLTRYKLLEMPHPKVSIQNERLLKNICKYSVLF